MRRLDSRIKTSYYSEPNSSASGIHIATISKKRGRLSSPRRERVGRLGGGMTGVHLFRAVSKIEQHAAMLLAAHL